MNPYKIKLVRFESGERFPVLCTRRDGMPVLSGKYTAPLTRITAGTVGVILNLALSFGYHMRWPNGFEDVFDWSPALIAVGAALALFRFKRSVTRYCTPLRWPDLLSKSLNNAERPACFDGKQSSAGTTCRF